MDKAVAESVWQRAQSNCEYCLLQQRYDETPFQIDHIIARKHGGTSEASNLALACMACNNHKGPNIAGLDPKTSELTRLFHPRNDRWQDHFAWNSAVLQGLTPTGRVTIEVLSINLAYRVEFRDALLLECVNLSAAMTQ
jgi:5-methylcytosine-specific restriction endonuclease McrA